MVSSIFLSLGSNLGNKEQNISIALEMIEERIGKIISLSALHITTPIGFYSRNDFINCVCEVVSILDIRRLFSITQDIEKEMGRCKKVLLGNIATESLILTLLWPVIWY